MKLTPLASALTLLGLSTAVLAQTAPASQRVEITGSSIKRAANDGALPLQVITADDIRQQGINSAVELLDRLGVNSANVDNATSRTKFLEQNKTA